MNTLSATILSVALSKITESTELIIAAPVTTRDGDSSGLIGSYINVLPSIMKIDKNESFLKYAKRQFEQSWNDIENRNLSLIDLTSSIRPGYHDDDQGIYNVMTEYVPYSEMNRLITMPPEMSNRLTEFYQRTQVAPPTKRPNFNCHSFIGYTFGELRSLHHTNDFDCELDTNETTVNKLLPAAPYAAIKLNGEHTHSLMGIDRPAYGLSIFGTNNPLVISANGLVKYLYGADQLRRIRHIKSRP